MSRLAYIFYIYIKVNTHHTPSKFAKAIEEIQTIQRNLPLHLSQNFPANNSDIQWEVEHPWVPLQRYLLTHVIDFLQLGITRVLVSQELGDETTKFRKLALDSSNRILQNYAIQVPRVYRLIWTVSAATVAAAVYISLDILAHPHDYREEVRFTIVELLRNSARELQKHAPVAVHAAKGSAVIKGLLTLLDQQGTDESYSPRPLHDLLQQLSTTNQKENVESSYPSSQFDEDNVMFAGVEDFSTQAFGIDNWKEFLVDF